MLAKNKAKFIRALQHKKYREEFHCFTVEGEKSVLELLHSQFKIRFVACSQSFWTDHQLEFKRKNVEVILCGPQEIESVSSFKTNETVLAVADMMSPDLSQINEGLTLVLDSIRDPGNLGTLLRSADWFGLRTIVASLETTDFYNPKVLQASMGSFCRVGVEYLELEKYLKNARRPIYAASKNGEPVHQFPFKKDCILVLGSESHGVSKSLLSYARKTIGIPGYGKAESLNVAVAAAIICDNYRRLNG